MASGWNLWVWLVGVAVRRYIDILITIITFPYSTCIIIIALFFAAASLLLCSFLNVFSFLFIFMLFLCNKANVALLKEHSRLFKNRDHTNIIGERK